MTLTRLTAQLLVLTAAFTFALSINYLHAWTSPPANPPTCPAGYAGCDAPINEGPTDQTKNGTLRTNALTTSFAVFNDAILSGTNNYLNFGSTYGPAGYGFRNNNGAVEYKNSGGSWGGVGGGTLTMSFSKYMHFQGRVTNGSFAIPAGWGVRTLNTSVETLISGASRSGNQITLPPGTYYVDGAAEARYSGGNKVVFYNVTDLQYTLVGVLATPNGGSSDNTGVPSEVTGKFTITSSKVFELRSYSGSAGSCTSLGEQIYSVCADLKIWKLD